MTTKGLLIWMTIIVVVISLTIPYAIYLLKVVFTSGNILGQLEMFKWLAVGAVLFAVLRRYLKGNLSFIETFSHELTHTAFAFLFNRRVCEFHANQGEGYMVSEYRNIAMGVPISLAPYCFPLFTFILLSFRWMMDFHGMWIFDLIIGCTLCFHFYCFKTQIGNHQPDINQYPLLLSYAYIATSWLIVFCIIVPSFFPNMNGHGGVQPVYNYGVFSSILRLFQEWWNNIILIIHLITK